MNSSNCSLLFIALHNSLMQILAIRMIVLEE